jgi:hypothetical protein
MSLLNLILYNISMKQMMVKAAGFRVRSNAMAATLATQLTADDLDRALDDHRNGNNTKSNSPAHTFLRAINAITQAAPHRNKAAKQARQDSEALQHAFDTLSYFLTVTPDDDNSIIVQTFTGCFVDADDQPVHTLSDAEIARRGIERTKIRGLKYPGACARFFELVLDIVIEEVIGWDQKKGGLTENGGLFGTPQAFSLAVKEQGRGMLHAHNQIWIEEFNRVRKQLHEGSYCERIKGELSKMTDAVASAKLFNKKHCCRPNRYQEAFDHPCLIEEIHLRQPPVVCDDQTLRNLCDKICMMMTRLACNQAIESSYWRMDNDPDVGLLTGYVLYRLPVELEFMDLNTFPH